jgi:type I restriction enzyme S subunit
VIDGLKPYPKYKPVGSRWLDEMPASWLRRRLKSVFREVDHRSRTGEEKLLSLRMRRGLVGHIEAGGRPIDAAALVGFKHTTPGQLVMNRMRAVVGLFAVTREPGLVSPDYAVFDAMPEANPSFFLHLFQTPALMAAFRAEAKGLGTGDAGFLRLYTDRFGNIPIALPPRDEQAAIVKFIDYADRRIRRYIRARQKLLRLHSETVASITDEAVSATGTRTVRLSAVAAQVTRPVARDSAAEYTPVGLYNRGRGIFAKPSCPGAELGDSEFFWLKDGDLIISGQFAWEGAVAMVTEDHDGCIASHRYPVLRAKPSVARTPFLLAFFRSSYGHLLLNLNSRGAAGRNRPLNVLRLMKEKVPVPPMHMQAKVVAAFQQEAALRNVVAREIGLVTEYRTRLIADVVTGKLDVRQAAANLPDELDTDEPDFDEADDLETDDLPDEESAA